MRILSSIFVFATLLNLSCGEPPAGGLAGTADLMTSADDAVDAEPAAQSLAQIGPDGGMPSHPMLRLVDRNTLFKKFDADLRAFLELQLRRLPLKARETLTIAELRDVIKSRADWRDYVQRLGARDRPYLDAYLESSIGYAEPVSAEREIRELSRLAINHQGPYAAMKLLGALNHDASLSAVLTDYPLPEELVTAAHRIADVYYFIKLRSDDFAKYQYPFTARNPGTAQKWLDEQRQTCIDAITQACFAPIHASMLQSKL